MSVPGVIKQTNLPSEILNDRNMTGNDDRTLNVSS